MGKESFLVERDREAIPMSWGRRLCHQRVSRADLLYIYGRREFSAQREEVRDRTLTARAPGRRVGSKTIRQAETAGSP